MARAKEFSDDLRYLWGRRGTVMGVVTLLAVANVIVAPGIAGMTYFVLDKAGLIANPQAFRHFLPYAAIGLAVLNAIAILTSISAKGLAPFSENSLRVFFAPAWGSDCEELVLALYDRFQQDIGSRGLSKSISPILINGKRAHFNAISAHDFLTRRNGRLLIYGEISRGKFQGKEIEGFRTVTFTFSHRPLAPTDLPRFAAEVGGALAFRSFAIREEESFVDHELVTRNLSEVTRFLVGASLTLEERFLEAIAILRPLLAEIQAAKACQAANPQFEIFMRSVASFLRGALHQHFTDIYEKSVIDRITDSSCDEYVAQCEALAEEMARLPQDNGASGLIRAILEFHRGRLNSAKRLVRDAVSALGHSHAAPHLSLAFLELWDGHYRQALKEYRHAEKCTDFDILTIRSVVRFLDSVADRHPDRPQLRFGIAFVNDRFFDRKRALVEYQHFIELAERETPMNLLKTEAISRVAALKMDTESPRQEKR